MTEQVGAHNVGNWVQHKTWWFLLLAATILGFVVALLVSQRKREKLTRQLAVAQAENDLRFLHEKKVINAEALKDNAATREALNKEIDAVRVKQTADKKRIEELTNEELVEALRRSGH